jgi:hypothetical protein
MKPNQKALAPVAAAMLFILSITGYAHGTDGGEADIHLTIPFSKSPELASLPAMPTSSVEAYIEAYVHAMAAVVEDECYGGGGWCANCNHNPPYWTCHIDCPFPQTMAHSHFNNCSAQVGCPCIVSPPHPGCSDIPREEG